jgi:putative FmdB family regulatory protein
MPRYDYQCDQCKSIFEVRATFKEKEAGLAPVCPVCKNATVHQIITAGLVLRTGIGSEESSSCCGPDAKPGCCG